jgi:adenylosuccinate synthase
MSTRVIVGGQWGDEGKGKIVDVLTQDAHVIVRYQGGNNAGHTVEIGDQKFILHLIPSGILRDGKICVLGNGVVLDPVGMVKEIDGLLARGKVLDGRLFISDRAHIVLPYHKEEDAGAESQADAATKIGTTKRGIGPAYTDKVSRKGLRAGDLLAADLKENLTTRFIQRNERLAAAGMTTLPVAETVEVILAAAKRLAPFIADTTVMLHKAIRAGENVVFEGAQGTMLDVDHGTYPYVTSSNASAGGAASGSGVPPNRIQEVVGVVKAYTTRVGEGPFPTELSDEIGKHIATVGREVGATTGRPRRCGWFDAVVARYAMMVNGVDWWTVTKMDVLDGLKVIRICTAYELDGKVIENMPSRVEDFARCKPVYEDMPGWSRPTLGVTRYEDLPDEAKSYLKRLEKLTGAPVGIVSVGPRREETMEVPGGIPRKG